MEARIVGSRCLESGSIEGLNEHSSSWLGLQSPHDVLHIGPLDRIEGKHLNDVFQFLKRCTMVGHTLGTGFAAT
jgi:hypothetical protein